MKGRLHTGRTLACLALLLALVAAAPRPGAGQSPPTPTKDEEAVRRAVEKLARDFNARDAKAVMSNFAADVVLVSPHHPDVDYKTMDEGFAKAYEKPPATPYGVVTRLVGRDPLRRRGARAESYWVERKTTRQAREQFERLF